MTRSHAPHPALAHLSRRQALTALGATLAAPWAGAQTQAQAATQVAGGRPITLVVSYPAGRLTIAGALVTLALGALLGSLRLNVDDL